MRLTPLASARLLVPLCLIIVVAALLLRGLALDPHRLPSALLNQTVPSFSLPSLQDPQLIIQPKDLKGEVSLVNVWATWCVTCAVEHHMLLEIAKSHEVKLIGLNYRDDRQKAQQWLREYGDPFSVTLFDEQGRAAIDLGVYGTPETFVIDKQGVIRYRHLGEITEEAWQQQLLPLVQRLQSQG